MESNRLTSTRAELEAGRHRLSVLVTDLCESRRLCDEMETEQFAVLVAGLHAIWDDVVVRHGGLVVQTQGDGANIVFGYPVPVEDGGRRAVDAALEIHRRVADLRPDGLPTSALPLAMHSGIDAGTLLVSEGDVQRGRVELTGGAINSAAHLCKQAQRGEIRVTRAALGPHEYFFEWADEAEPLLVQSLIGTVVGRSDAASRFDATARRGMTPLIGRTEVIGRLLAYMTSRHAGAPRCVLVVGPPGIGKTRVLEELSQQPALQGYTLLRGTCENYLGAEVLQPFMQMLRGPARAITTQSAGERCGRLGAGSQIGDLLAQFTALCANRPVAMLIDDWQWADDASRQLVDALLQLPNGPRMTLASRPRDDGALWIAGADHLILDPFEEAQTGIATRRWLHADPFLIARIHAYTGGVPLFIEELCHSVPAEGLPNAMQGRGATQTWLATLVAARLGQLPIKHAATLRAAAVIGNLVPLRLLEAACGHTPTAATLQALADADFLYAGDHAAVLRFKHGITRDAVYEAIGLHERKALHQRVVLALDMGGGATDGEDTLEARAYHSRGAGHWEQASIHAELAGDKAAAAFAIDRARGQYQAAMQALDRSPELSPAQTLRWCALSSKLGMTCIFDPLGLGDDISVFVKAVARARELDDTQVSARAQYWLGYMCYGFGRFREGVEHAREALRLALDANDSRLAAQIEATLGQILAANCDYDEAIALMDKAVGAKRQGRRGGGGIAIGSAYTLACKGSVLADRGDFGAAHVCFDEAVLLLDGSTHPVANSVRNWIAVALVWQGRWHEAERIAAESARIAENTRSLLLLVVCRAAAGFARWADTGDAAGLQQLRDAVRWMEARRGQFFTSLYYGWLVEACVAEGSLTEARRYAAHVLRRARAGERLGEAVTGRAMAMAMIAVGDAARAERWLQRAEVSARIRGSPREAALNQLARGRLLERQGQMEAGSERIEAARTALRALGMPVHANTDRFAGVVPAT